MTDRFEFDEERRPSSRWDDWRAALAEVDLPEPAPGKKIITFNLPAVDEPPQAKPRRTTRSKAQELAAAGLSADKLAAMNAEDYRDLSPKPRRRAREAALLLLFAACSGGGWQSAEHILADVDVNPAGAQFARLLAEQAYVEMAENDALLSAYARDWDVSRFSAVDRAVLRLGLCELRHTPDEDRTIVINEAVELGKKFGSEESGSFVNGMLDNIYQKELKGRSGETP